MIFTAISKEDIDAALMRLRYMQKQTPACAIGAMIQGGYEEPYTGEYIGNVIRSALLLAAQYLDTLPENPSQQVVS